MILPPSVFPVISVPPHKLTLQHLHWRRKKKGFNNFVKRTEKSISKSSAKSSATPTSTRRWSSTSSRRKRREKNVAKFWRKLKVRWEGIVFVQVVKTLTGVRLNLSGSSEPLIDPSLTQRLFKSGLFCCSTFWCSFHFWLISKPILLLYISTLVYLCVEH